MPPHHTRDLDTRDLIETAIDVPELRQVDADVLLAVAEAVIETVGPELERLRARVAELDAAEQRTEWSVRAPHGAVWQLSPQSEQHARSMQASEGEGVLVTREARTIYSPWREVSS